MKRSNLFWGLALILAGGLFILRSMGILKVDVMQLIWPLGMMFFGAWLIAGRFFAPQPSESESLQIPLEGATRMKLEMDYGAGRLQLSAGTSPDMLVTGSFMGGVSWDVDRDETEAEVSLKIPPTAMPLAGVSGGLAWDMQINPSVPFELDVDSGASDLHLDFSDLQLTKFNMDTGASSSHIILPKNVPFCMVDIDSGAASVKIEIPAGVAALIDVDDSVGSINVDITRFLPVGSKRYQSADYMTAERKAEIRVQTGAGVINIQ